MTENMNNPQEEEVPADEAAENTAAENDTAAPEAAGQAAEGATPEQDLQQQAGEYLAGWQRAQADYKNLQRDTARRVSDITKYATQDLLTQLLPIVDYFAYAFKGIPEAERDSSWLKGVEHIQTNFLRVLEDNGVNKIKTIGEAFNPSMHESLDTVEGTGKEHGIIVEEVAPGFTLNGKVIRPAKVKIAK